MTLTFTPELLIKYIYRETSPTESLAVLDTLRDNQDIQSEYTTLYRASKALPKVIFDPSKACLGEILKYSSMKAVGEQA